MDPDNGSITNTGTATATIDLDAVENITCTYTNTAIPASLTLVKVVTNDDGGTSVVGDWTLTANGITFTSGAPQNVSVAGGVVYCGSDNGILYALDAQTGKSLWQFEAGGPIQASPAVVGGLIVFGANDHHFYALDRRTGQKLWDFRSSGFCTHAPPVMHGDRVYAAGWADWVWCLDVKSGKPLWPAFVPVSIEAMSWSHERLWVRSPYYLVELDPTKGTWLRIAEASYGYGGMAFAGGRIFQSGLRFAIFLPKVLGDDRSVPLKLLRDLERNTAARDIPFVLGRIEADTFYLLYIR